MRVGRPGFLTPEGELQAEQMAARAWCTAREAMGLGTKPECPLESVIKQAWYTSLLRIRIDDRRRWVGPAFSPQAAILKSWLEERWPRWNRGQEATPNDGRADESRRRV